jgi:hypothetical protein
VLNRWKAWNEVAGHVHGISIDPVTGARSGGSDPRSDGAAIGYQSEVFEALKLRSLFGGMMIPLFVLGHFSHHIMTAITVPLIPFIRSAFSLDYAQSGLVVSAFSISYGIAQLPAGWLADRIAPRTLMTLSISGVAVVGMMVGFSQTYVLMILFLLMTLVCSFLLWGESKQRDHC